VFSTTTVLERRAIIPLGIVAIYITVIHAIINS
jgi:hypothetical protein